MSQDQPRDPAITAATEICSMLRSSMARSGPRRAIGRGGGLGRPRFSSQFTRIGGGAVIRVGGVVIRIGGAVTRTGGAAIRVGAVTRVGGAAIRVGGAATRIGGAATRIGGAVTRIGGAVTRAGVMRAATCSRGRGGSGSTSRSRARGIGGPAGLRATCGGATPRGDFGTVPPPDECQSASKVCHFNGRRATRLTIAAPPLNSEPKGQRTGNKQGISSLRRSPRAAVTALVVRLRIWPAQLVRR